MTRLPALCLFLSVAGFDASANDVNRHLDVPKWFDQCTALSRTQIADEMDTRCMSAAYDYCEIGRLYEERRPCIENLNAHIHEKTEEIAALLPDRPKGLSTFREHSYRRNLAQFRNSEIDADCAQMTEFMCESLKNVLRWSTARNLARISVVSEGLGAE